MSARVVIPFLTERIEIRSVPLSKAQIQYAELWGLTAGLFEKRKDELLFFTDGFGNALAQELDKLPEDWLRSSRNAVSKFLRNGIGPKEEDILACYVYEIVKGMTRR